MKRMEENTGAEVRLERVSVLRRGKDGSERLILDAVSCVARGAEITTIVGPSGGGKSTLIRLINRLSDPSSGTIRVDGTDITQLDPIRLRGRVAMVQQKPFMFQETVLDNLRRPFVYRNAPPPLADSPELLHSLELARISPDLLGRDARTLSLGEQQRVSLARALLTSPKVLLLDEPTSALDRPTADGLAATLRDICRSQRLTVMLVTHDLRLAEHCSDHLYFLEGGRIREEGKPATLLTTPESDELRRFLGHTTQQQTNERIHP